MNTNANITARFELGRTLITPGAQEAIEAAGQAPHEFLQRHEAGDWGDALSENDRRENELSVEQGFRILSAYCTSKGQRIWVITEADRSATTILLPEEY